MAQETAPGRVVIVSGPAGSGKTTVLQYLLAECPLPLTFSVSATTRQPRPGEKDGVNYHFLTPEEFERRKAANDFLECFEVHQRGYWYGTLWSEVASGLSDQKWVILDVDVEGMRAVLQRFPDAITIFISPGSLEELERRLRHRNTETPADLERRLAAAPGELACAPLYQHQITNDIPQRAAAEICHLLLQVRGSTNA